jgi:hypothetical protein
MPNMLFHFAEYLKVNLQAKRFERQMHFNVLLKEMHPPSTSSGARLRSGTDNLINEGGEKRGPRSCAFSPPLSNKFNGPRAKPRGVIHMFYRTTVILKSTDDKL